MACYVGSMVQFCKYPILRLLLKCDMEIIVGM
jgi:hypothetical protein